MSMLLSLWMASWYILMTLWSTNDMSRKYYRDFMLTASSPMQTNVSFTSHPVNTSDICYLPMVLRWPKTKSKLSKIGLTMQSQGHPILPGFHQLLPLFHLQILKNHCSAHAHTCKNVPWNFTNECHSTFNTLKKAFTTAPVLTHWILDTQITVETDTSDYALTAILSIMTPSGKLHPIVFLVPLLDVQNS